MRALLVVNPSATATTAAARDVITSALSSRLSLTVAHTDHRGHAAELAARATADGVDLVVVHGGDGTVNEVVNGLLGDASGPLEALARRPTLAVVPGGSANVFARALGIAADPVEATAQLMDCVAHRQVRRIGLGRADDRWFLFNGGLGWDAETVHAVEQRRNRGKEATPGRYLRATVRHYLRGRRRPARFSVTLTGDDGRVAPTVDGLHMVFVSASDPWTYFSARAVHTNPATTVDTGLGVFAMSTLAVPTVARVVTQMLSRSSDPRARGLLRQDDVARIQVRCSEPSGLQLDGDYLGVRDSVTFDRVPSALAVLAPPA